LYKSRIDISFGNRRYIAVFHLVTAASGAEKFYTLDNNGIRIESVEQARAIDEKTCRAWIGHPKLFVIGKSKQKKI
jgi:hypothetical protein